MDVLFSLAALLASIYTVAAGSMPSKIYGVNIGGWYVFMSRSPYIVHDRRFDTRSRLVLEPWMLPAGMDVFRFPLSPVSRTLIGIRQNG